MSSMGLSEHRSLPAAFQASAERVPSRLALRTPGGSVQLTWADYATAVQRVAGSLAALGVSHGDRVAFLARNRPELAIAEVAAMHLGAAGVALYATSPPATIKHVLADSDPRVLLVQSDLEARLYDVDHSVAQVFTLDAAATAHPQLATVAAPADFDFQAAWRGVRPEDLAALIYTSGTTSLAKAVEWTHLAAIGSASSFDVVLAETDGIRDVSYAPFASLAERFGGHWHALMRGSTRTICEDPAQLGEALLDARPTRVGGPPQVWQRLQRALEGSLDSQERPVFDTAVARVHALARDEPTESLTETHEMTLAVLRARIGLDQITQAVSTAAPCPLSVHQHYHALGVPFRECFAMTETGVVAAQRPGLMDLGTLGGPLPGYELQTAKDGELLVRSPHAPSSYRNRPQDSADTYDKSGWIHTGDLAKLDAEGRLRLVGRKKETIVPEHGHNVAPVQIESALKEACPEIAQICVIGDGRPHLAALIVIDANGPGEHEQTCASIADAIERVNATFEPRERIEAHTVLTDPWLPGAELTETLKMRRAQIAEHYAAEIDAMYMSESSLRAEPGL